MRTRRQGTVAGRPATGETGAAGWLVLGLVLVAGLAGVGTVAVARPAADQAQTSPPAGNPGEPNATSATTRPPVTVPPPPEACRPTTVERSAASVLLVGMPGVVDAADPLVDELVDLGVGGVLLNRTNVVSAQQVSALTAGLRVRFGGHLTIALDQEGGRVSPLADLGLGGPSARRLGRLTGDAVEAAGAAAGQEAASLGATLVLAPVADLDDGPAGAVIGDRSFGSDPGAVGEAARRYARGLRSAGVAATAKHWPGHAMAPDTHLGAGTAAVDGSELVARHVAAFAPLLADRVEAVMVGHVTYPSLGPLPASLNPAAYRLLREAGHRGPAMTDALGMGSIHTRWGFDRSAAMALAAGADIALANQGGEARVMRDGIVAAVASGEVLRARLDEAVTRAAALRPGC